VDGGLGALRVNELLKDAFRQGSFLLISVANWGEVFYSLWLKQGEEKARQTLANLLRLPLEIISVDVEQALKAGEIKAVHKLPYVDSLAAALAELRQAVLVTSDRHFEKLGKRIQIRWIQRG
jgi:predicted nucleic acid-binding protein